MTTELTPSRKEYIGRINRVLDAVDEDLARPWHVDDMAAVAAFSPYHFHRIFKALMGENLAAYVLRLRLEKAASYLIYRPYESVTNIALDHGFGSSAHFARAFKAHFGCSATAYREQQKSKIRQQVSKGMKAQIPFDRHAEGRMTSDPPDLDPIEPQEVTLLDMEPLRVIYLRHFGPYGISSMTAAWERLVRWAAARDLIGADTEFVGIPRDDPEITDPERCRYDLAVVNETLQPTEDFGATRTPGGRYALWKTAVGEDEVGLAWERFYTHWLTDSGFLPDDRPCLELYGDGSPMPDGRYVVRFCLPVIPL